MSDPLFHVVCAARALDDDTAGWAAEMLRDGDLALLADDSGLEGIDRVAHALDAQSVVVVRSEATPDRQDRVVMSYAGGLPLVWLSAGFSPEVRTWARDRAPMTLLVEADGPLPSAERPRIERFVALLGRQSE